MRCIKQVGPLVEDRKALRPNRTVTEYRLLDGLYEFPEEPGATVEEILTPDQGAWKALFLRAVGPQRWQGFWLYRIDWLLVERIPDEEVLYPDANPNRVTADPEENRRVLDRAFPDRIDLGP